MQIIRIPQESDNISLLWEKYDDLRGKWTPNFRFKNCFRNTWLRAWKSFKSYIIPLCLSEFAWVMTSRAHLIKIDADWGQLLRQMGQYWSVSLYRCSVNSYATLLNLIGIWIFTIKNVSNWQNITQNAVKRGLCRIDTPAEISEIDLRDMITIWDFASVGDCSSAFQTTKLHLYFELFQC